MAAVAEALLYAEWLDTLGSLWVAYDKPVDQKILDSYEKEFADIPLGLLEKAISRCKRTCTFFPRISEIWKAIRDECARSGVAGPGDYMASVNTGIFICSPAGWQRI